MNAICKVRFGVVSGLMTVGILACAVSSASGQLSYARLRGFGFGDRIVTSPVGPLVEGTNGALYGVSAGGGEAEKGTIFQVNKDGTGLSVLWSFVGTNGDGAYPWGGLCLATNGSLYGTTSSGGLSNLGSIFRIDQNGSNYVVINSFTGYAGDGAGANGSLIQTSDGMLYGTTYQGGNSNLGTVFRIAAGGGGYQVLKRFAGGVGDGANPQAAGVIQGTNGMLFGTTALGGSNNLGTVFTLNLDGSGYQVLQNFTGVQGDGALPLAGLTQGRDGALYGTTSSGGVSKQGTVFQMNQDGSGYTVIWRFQGAQGTNPVAPLALGTNGVFYGTTEFGGSGGNGTVFTIGPGGSGFEVLKSFQALGQDGANPGALMQASDGLLYGTTFEGGDRGLGTLAPVGGSIGTVFSLDPNSANYTVILYCLAAGGDGQDPSGTLIQATNGCLYGTTAAGGDYGFGAIYRMNLDGTGYSVLHSFSGTNGLATGSDGAAPAAGLVQGADGALYGTTECDGIYEMGDAEENFGVVSGYGTIFEIQLDGTGYQVLKNFTGGSAGGSPAGALVQATNGVLYGTTSTGGTGGAGTFFRLNPGGSGYSVVRGFVGSEGTYGPSGPLLQGSDGRLYGTTSGGGTTANGVAFSGAAYAISLDGSSLQVLKLFGGTNGSNPTGLIQGLDGALYGTAAFGGAYDHGTAFKMNLDGSGFIVLRNFGATSSDGQDPVGPLVQGGNGVLYGACSGGGLGLPAGSGTVFQMNPDGTGYQTLHDFVQNFYDGLGPSAGLLLANNGALYGVTPTGGRDQNGTIYYLVPQAVLSPPNAAVDGCSLCFTGFAGRSYTIERATSVLGPWTGIGTATAGPTGAAQFLDTNPPPVSAFYRASFP